MEKCSFYMSIFVIAVCYNKSNLKLTYKNYKHVYAKI